MWPLPPPATHTLRSLVPSAPRAWQPCRRHRGQPLTNADGQVSKVGSTMVGSMFGEGIARGTVRFEKGDGVNVCKSTGVGRRQQLNAGKPPSRGSRIRSWRDYSLFGSSVHMRWEEYGWQLCRITDIITNATPRVFKKFRTTALFGPTAARGQQSSVLRTMDMDQMLATTHGQSYLAQSLWRERARDPSAD